MIASETDEDASEIGEAAPVEPRETRPPRDVPEWPRPALVMRYLVASAGVWLWTRRRPLVIGLVTSIVAFGVLVVIDRGLGGVLHDHRQGELAADLAISGDEVSPGEALGVLQIPAIGVNEVVVQGDSPSLVRGGAAHRASTVVPGERGNSVISGHRTRYGGPFEALGDLKPNDEVVFQVKNATYPVSFRVASVTRVSADQTEVLRATTGYQLTLVTSAPGLLTGDRLVVVATADGAPVPLPTEAIAPTVADRGFNGGRGSIILNARMAMAYLAAVSLWIARGVLSTYRARTRWIVMVPGSAVILYCLLANLDLVLPLTS